MFGKKPIDWCKKGQKLLGKNKFEEAMECFARAYSESDKEKKEDERLRVKVGALEGMSKVYSFPGKYEDALDCFGKGLNLFSGEKGVEGDPLVGEVSGEKRW